MIRSDRSTLQELLYVLSILCVQRRDDNEMQVTVTHLISLVWLGEMECDLISTLQK